MNTQGKLRIATAGYRTDAKRSLVKIYICCAVLLMMEASLNEGFKD